VSNDQDHDNSDGHEGGHVHVHVHDHSHDGAYPHDRPVPEHLDLSVADADLTPHQLGRRSFFRRAGLLGVAAAATNVLGGSLASSALADEPRRRGEGSSGAAGLLWLTGDHHIHTQYSPDAQYRTSQQVQRGAQYGLDWMVITDHGSVAHAKYDVARVNADIVQARVDNARTLVFQGLEWNIPSAEHGTVFVAPGPGEVPLLQQFESTYDGLVTRTTSSGPENEALARSGLAFLRDAVSSNRIDDALMLANHPARKGLDSPHEIRGWRDTAPTIAVGMEGAPGHQAAAIPGAGHNSNGRGYYDNAPSKNSFPAYPAASYVTYGGFDWMTATVGGLWDSLLSEGKPWWISANSDSHQAYGDTLAQGTADFPATGSHGDPVDTGSPIYTYGDFFPGFYSSTVVGATSFSYGSVMEGIRAGRMYVLHGGLLGALSVQVVGGDAAPVTLGGTLLANSGRDLELQIDIALADRPNYHGDVPRLANVDLIVGSITGPATDPDTIYAPDTRVVESFSIPSSARNGTHSIRYRLKGGKDPFYLRLRGSDGRRNAVGLRGVAVDPAGPKVDALGNADPWQDLWFYTNPIFVLPRR